MATSFDEIYSLNSSITRDSQLQGKPDNIYYFLLAQRLQFAIGAFAEYSYIDILDTVDFTQEIYVFESDELTTEYLLSPAPPTDCEFYVEIDGVKLLSTEYSFNSLTNIMTLPNGGNIYIGAYVIGQFNNTLTIKEKVILADAMTEWFVESHVNDSMGLEQIMYAGVEMSAQSQHNKINLDIEKFRNSKSYKDMIMYTYSKNMPKTINLAKRSGIDG